MTYLQIHKGAGLTLLAIGLIVLCAVVLSHLHSSSSVFTNCTQARKAGYSNIPSTSKFYNPALDRDKDGTACE